MNDFTIIKSETNFIERLADPVAFGFKQSCACQLFQARAKIWFLAAVTGGARLLEMGPWVESEGRCFGHKETDGKVNESQV